MNRRRSSTDQNGSAHAVKKRNGGSIFDPSQFFTASVFLQQKQSTEEKTPTSGVG